LLQHIGVYAFKRDSLSRFSKLAPSPLEVRERLEQLRALEAGMRIDLALVDHSGLSVDTYKDIETLTFGLAD
jgi:3-deoxy-manno-octulosonate cytidylyltransferase (CMP-KDO synthetase)